MGKKATKKLITSGKLKTQIQHRKKVQHVKKRQREQEDRIVTKQQEREAAKKIEDLDIDEFLAGDFLDDDLAIHAAVAPNGVGLHGSDSEDDMSLSGSDDDDSLGVSSDDDNVPRQQNGAALPPSSSSDDDEADEADADPLIQQNKSLKGEVSKHKSQLQALKKKDPEFYKYLEATDKQLLAFGSDSEGDEDSDNDNDSDEDSDGDVDVDAEKQDGENIENIEDDDNKQQITQHQSVTLAMVDTWCTTVINTQGVPPPMGAVKSILRAYRVACHYGDSEDMVEEGMKIASSAVYNKLLLFVLKEMDGVLRRMLGVEGNVVVSDLPRLARWKKVEPLIKTYLGNTLHLLGAMTESTMLAFILRRVRTSIVFLAPYGKLQRKYLKQALDLFGSANAPPRVQSILLVRSMALSLPSPALDNALKGAYKAFMSNSKFVSANSAAALDFMAACLVELHGLDAAASYAHAFGAIRHLAQLLRSALTAKTKDAYRLVYCWQTISALELWAKVLAAHATEKNSDLRPLVYPVAQLLLGTARLLPTPSYFPLRLRCIRALNRLSTATGVFVPVAPLLLDIFQWTDLAKSPKQPPAGAQQPDLLLQLRVSKNNARSPAYQEDIIMTTVDLLGEHLSQWSRHISFPELSHFTVVSLRRFIKVNQVDKFRKPVRGLIDATERNIAFVGRARDQIEFSPKDVSDVAAFLDDEKKPTPLDKYYELAQEAAKERQKLRMVDEVSIGNGNENGVKRSRKEEQQSNNNKKKSVSVDSDSDMDDDEDDSEPDDFEGDLLPIPGSNKMNKEKKKSGEDGGRMIDDGGEDEEYDDEIGEYQLSDEENEYEDEGMVKRVGSEKRAKR